MDRRRFLKMSGSIGIAGLTGCISTGQETGSNQNTNQNNRTTNKIISVEGNENQCSQKDDGLPSFVINLDPPKFAKYKSGTKFNISVENHGKGDGCFDSDIYLGTPKNQLEQKLVDKNSLIGYIESGETKNFEVSIDFPNSNRYTIYIGEDKEKDIHVLENFLDRSGIYRTSNNIEISIDRIESMTSFEYIDRLTESRYTMNMPSNLKTVAIKVSHENRDTKPHSVPLSGEYQLLTKTSKFEPTNTIVNNQYRGYYSRAVGFDKTYLRGQDMLHKSIDKKIHGGDSFSGWFFYEIPRMIDIEDLYFRFFEKYTGVEYGYWKL